LSVLRRTRAALAGVATSSVPTPATPQAPRPPHPAGIADRAAWVDVVRRLAEPVLANLAAGTLRARMPVEQMAGEDRSRTTYLEAVGRLLSGIAPWLELEPDDTDEGRLRARYRQLTLDALRVGLDQASPDALNFREGAHPVVDAAYLGLAVLRAPRLFATLDGPTHQRLIEAFQTTRTIRTGFNNWLLFPATVEATLAHLDQWWDPMRIDYALRSHVQWYVGDGIYGDGPEFHWDYYDSFVIHPMLTEVLDVVGHRSRFNKELRVQQQERARRYATIQERLIGADGTYPPIGRSLAYRGGAFHALAQTALRDELPEGLSAAQVRGALTAVIGRTMDAPGTFDDEGWLRIGLSGHQPGIGERYVSTGSLYMAGLALLPLGLPATHAFWADAPVPWTAQRAWSGSEFPIDHAIEGEATPE
jgi:hypothetical protein